MKRNVKNDKVVRAITIGLAAMIAATSMPVNIYAEDEQNAPEGGSNGENTNTETQETNQQSTFKVTEAAIEVIAEDGSKIDTKNEVLDVEKFNISEKSEEYSLYSFGEKSLGERLGELLGEVKSPETTSEGEGETSEGEGETTKDTSIEGNVKAAEEAIDGEKGARKQKETAEETADKITGKVTDSETGEEKTDPNTAEGKVESAYAALEKDVTDAEAAVDEVVTANGAADEKKKEVVGEDGKSGTAAEKKNDISGKASEAKGYAAEAQGILKDALKIVSDAEDKINGTDDGEGNVVTTTGEKPLQKQFDEAGSSAKMEELNTQMIEIVEKAEEDFNDKIKAFKEAKGNYDTAKGEYDNLVKEYGELFYGKGGSVENPAEGSYLDLAMKAQGTYDDQKKIYDAAVEALTELTLTTVDKETGEETKVDTDFGKYQEALKDLIKLVGDYNTAKTGAESKVTTAGDELSSAARRLAELRNAAVGAKNCLEASFTAGANVVDAYNQLNSLIEEGITGETDEEKSAAKYNLALSYLANYYVPEVLNRKLDLNGNGKNITEGSVESFVDKDLQQYMEAIGRETVGSKEYYIVCLKGENDNILYVDLEIKDGKVVLSTIDQKDIEAYDIALSKNKVLNETKEKTGIDNLELMTVSTFKENGDKESKSYYCVDKKTKIAYALINGKVEKHDIAIVKREDGNDVYYLLGNGESEKLSSGGVVLGSSSESTENGITYKKFVADEPDNDIKEEEYLLDEDGQLVKKVTKDVTVSVYKQNSLSGNSGEETYSSEENAIAAAKDAAKEKYSQEVSEDKRLSTDLDADGNLIVKDDDIIVTSKMVTTGTETITSADYVSAFDATISIKAETFTDGRSYGKVYLKVGESGEKEVTVYCSRNLQKLSENDPLQYTYLNDIIEYEKKKYVVLSGTNFNTNSTEKQSATVKIVEVKIEEKFNAAKNLKNYGYDPSNSSTMEDAIEKYCKSNGYYYIKYSMSYENNNSGQQIRFAYLPNGNNVQNKSTTGTVEDLDNENSSLIRMKDSSSTTSQDKQERRYTYTYTASYFEKQADEKKEIVETYSAPGEELNKNVDVPKWVKSKDEDCNDNYEGWGEKIGEYQDVLTLIDDITKAQNLVSSLQTEVTTLSGEINALEAKKEALNKLLAEAEGKLNNKAPMPKDMVTRYSNDIVIEDFTLLDESDEEIEGLLSKIEELEDYIADKEKEIEEAEGDLIEKENEYLEAQKTLDELKNQVEDNKKRIADQKEKEKPAPGGNGGINIDFNFDDLFNGGGSGEQTAGATASTAGGVAGTVAGAITVAAPAAAVTFGDIAAPVAGVAGARVRRPVAAVEEEEEVVNKASDNKKAAVVEEETVAPEKELKKAVKLDENKVPLAVAPTDVVKEDMNWWWLLIVALLGATGVAMYENYKKKQAEKADVATAANREKK